ncbi:MAG: radical SAM protein [bacterium]
MFARAFNRVVVHLLISSARAIILLFAMKPALIICPFFTNGDWPPLGIACVNGALREAGEEPVCFDLNYQALQEFPAELNLYRQLVNMGHAGEQVVFVLRPELLISFLYREDHPGLKWGVGPEEQPAAASLYLGLKWAVSRQADHILAHRPEAFLFSTYISNLLWSMMLARELKARSPGTPIIFGGPGVGLPEVQGFVLGAGFADALVAGEGERTVVDLCRGIGEGRYRETAGVATLADGAVRLSPRTPGFLSELPSPSFTGFPLPGLEVADYAANRPNPFRTPFFTGLPVYSSRGCVNRCAYCSESAYWKSFRFREPEAVFRDLARLSEEHREDHFLLGDSAVNFKHDWLRSFTGLLSGSGLDLKICAYMFADPALDRDMAESLFKAGFRYVTLGIETFSGRLRNKINKRYDGDDLFRPICALTGAGIHVKANLLVGFPGETEEDLEDSLRYIKRWRELSDSERGPGTLYWDAGHPLRLEAYSDLYNRPAEYGIRLIQDTTPSLPDEMQHLYPFIRPFFQKWTTPARAELIARSNLMQELAGSERK